MRPYSLHSLSLAALLALAPLSGPALSETAAAAETPAPPASAPVLPAISVAAVATRHMVDRVIATGFVNPVEQVNVQPLIEGQPIEQLLADVGDVVTEGQVLAVLSDSTLLLQKAQSVASLESAKATIAQAEAQLVEAEASAQEAQRVAERTRKLTDQGTSTQAALDTANSNAMAATARVSVARQALEAARAQVALYEAQMANVELQLTRTEVKAPYAGRITARNATIGAIATAAGSPMFVIEKDGALELWADVAEADILRLAEGQTAALTGVGTPDGLTGTVRLVEPVIDSLTRLGRARISIAAETGLRAGMFIEADVIVAEHDALAVPVTAISAAGGEQTVLRVKDGMVEQIAVTLGIREKGWVEVTKGLAIGDLVVAKAGAFVRPGDKINPVLSDLGN
jgi:HlyD family secretion protein